MMVPMNRTRYLAVALWALSTLVHAEIRTEAEAQPGNPEVVQKSRRAPPGHITETRLPAFIAPKAQVEQRGVPTQIGHAREVDTLASTAATRDALAWEATAHGARRAALSVTSPGAAATRLALRIERAPAGTMFRFYPPSGDAPFEVSYEEIAAQMRAGATAAQADTVYWSPVVEGETQAVEVELAPGHEPAELALAIPSASHLVTSAEIGFFMPKAAAASCNVDSMCHQETWSTESAAVARIVFTDGGSTFLCTGTLLADRDPSTVIPYFLTANHCVSTQAVASTVQTYWFYRATSCDSGTRGPYQTRTGGAALLYASASTDTSFIRLNSTPPAGAGYAGWLVGSAPATGAKVTGIHNPRGDLQKISFGNLDDYLVCTPATNHSFDCRHTPNSLSSFYSVTWREGLTEPGSSGSALFLDSGRYLVGQLYGGEGSCTEAGSDVYGRFDVAYGMGLSRWLASEPAKTPSAAPLYDYSDLWWNANESGWGLSITQHASNLFAAWYVYDAGGNPTWIVMPGGQWTASDTYSGDLYATTGPDPRFAFDPSRVTTNKVGTGTLTFSARDRGTLTYTVNGVTGSKPITRQLFGPADSTPVGSYGDLWWVSSESGWGLAISQQYRTLFAVWYTYRPDGTSAWYVMPGGSWISSTTYRGTLYRTWAAPRAFLGADFDPSAVGNLAVGTLTLRFSGTSSATMSYTLDGVSGTKALTRQSF
jgi:V8-like Glu-specific endopeptidase